MVNTPYVNIGTMGNPLLKPRMEIPVFNSKQDAMEYAMGVDSSVIGMDGLKQVVWIIKTDSTGAKILCEPRLLGDVYVPEPEPDIKEMDKKLGDIGEKLNMLEEFMASVNKRFDAFEELIK